MFFLLTRREDVDGRNKSGHDEMSSPLRGDDDSRGV